MECIQGGSWMEPPFFGFIANWRVRILCGVFVRIRFYEPAFARLFAPRSQLVIDFGGKALGLAQIASTE